MSKVMLTEISVSVIEKCLVCGDDSSGFHYGVLACCGCKTFFRRTITKQHKLVCQRQGNCAVDKDARRTCRHCRFKRCQTAGMDEKLVQSSRDAIAVSVRQGRKKNVEPTLENTDSPSSGTEGPVTTASRSQVVENEIHQLLRLEILLESHRKMLIDSGRPFEQSMKLSDDIPLTASLDDRPKITAQRTLDDVIQAWRLDAILLLAYVNRMDDFSKIPKEERVLMIKTFSMKFVTITSVMRTHKFGDDTCFILANNVSSAVNGAHLLELSSKPFGDISMWTNVRMKIREELMLPTSALNLTNEEYVAIKAIMFWNADLPGISAATKDKAKAKRELLLDELYEHIRMYLPENKTAQRFGNILLLCGAFSSCSLAAAESMRLAKFFNVLDFDQNTTDLMFSS